MAATTHGPRRVVIKTGDPVFGDLTSEVATTSPPTIGNVYQIGAKMFEAVSFTDDGEFYHVDCRPHIEAEGSMQ